VSRPEGGRELKQRLDQRLRVLNPSQPQKVLRSSGRWRFVRATAVTRGPIKLPECGARMELSVAPPREALQRQPWSRTGRIPGKSEAWPGTAISVPSLRGA
jgi:hypothetical protein